MPTDPSPLPPLPPLEGRAPFLPLVTALGNEVRWRLLQALVHGEGRELRELAAAVGHASDNTRRHLAILVEAGLVFQGRGHLYQMVASRLPQPGQPLLECGHCLLRLDEVK